MPKCSTRVRPSSGRKRLTTVWVFERVERYSMKGILKSTLLEVPVNAGDVLIRLGRLGPRQAAQVLHHLGVGVDPIEVGSIYLLQPSQNDALGLNLGEPVAGEHHASLVHVCVRECSRFAYGNQFLGARDV